MPLYEYKCETCGATFEVIQKFSDPPVEQCRVCGGRVQKVLSAPAIQFKGSGWYVTDYAKRSGVDAGKSSDGTSATTSDASTSKTESTAAATPATDSASDKKK